MTVRVLAEQECTPEELALWISLAELRVRYRLSTPFSDLMGEMKAAIRLVRPLVLKMERAAGSDLDVLPADTAEWVHADSVDAIADLMGGLTDEKAVAKPQRKAQALADFVWGNRRHFRGQEPAVEPAVVLILARAIERLCGRPFGWSRSHWPGNRDKCDRTGPPRGAMLATLLAALDFGSAVVRPCLTPEAARPSYKAQAETVLKIIKAARRKGLRERAAAEGIDLDDPASLLARAQDFASLLDL